MTVEQGFDEPNSQFPVGMRVLAVDDNPICLMVLETLLRKCQYHVTTTNQAIMALKLLRENKNMFDLVISDVHMPDMDGFKLLELVGLEMDLPVIMLSANGDTKLVMKGITHGACDYLLKPVRIEELMTIWKHVVKKKKFDPEDQNTCDKIHRESERGRGLNRKRKDQNEDEDDDHAENEDPSTQKKPRVVWTGDLHRKFVAAVNQLGLDRAVPKKILDLMNVDKLTRENVASHLQKYRLYLKRISCVASQQAHLAAALGGADSSYLRMSSLNGFGNFHSMAGSAQFQNGATGPFSSSGIVGRLNTPAGLGMRGLSSSGTVQPVHAENLSNPVNYQNKFQQVMLPGNQNGNKLQGLPTSFEFDEPEHKNSVDPVGDLSTAIDSMVFHLSGAYSDGIVNGSSSSNSLLGVPPNPVIVQRHPQEIERREVCGNQSCVTVASSKMEFPSHLPNFAACSNSWPVIQTSQIQSNSFVPNNCFERATPSDFRNNISSMAADAGSSSCDISSLSSITAGFPNPRTELQCQEPQGRNSLMNSMIPRAVTVCNRSNDFSMTGLSDLVDPLTMNHNEVDQSPMETTAKLKQGYIVNQRRPQDGYPRNNLGSLEDLVSAMLKQDEDKKIPREGNFGYGSHSLGKCM